MSMTDPVADFLTRVRNGITAAHQDVEIPSSRLKRELARILKEQGYIRDFEIVPTGNAVSLEDEMLKVAANQMDFQAATTLYTRGLGLIKTAIGK